MKLALTLLATSAALGWVYWDASQEPFRVVAYPVPLELQNAYVDGARKLVNDNQRNWVDMLAERGREWEALE